MVDIPSWYDLNKKISFLTQHGLTKWSGSASQHLIAPVIFFLNTTMQWEINYIMKLQIYHEVSKGAFQHPPSTDQTQSTGSCFFWEKARIPLQDLYHVILWVPSHGKIWLLCIGLSHRLLLQVDEAILPGRDQRCSWLELAVARGNYWKRYLAKKWALLKLQLSNSRAIERWSPVFHCSCNHSGTLSFPFLDSQRRRSLAFSAFSSSCGQFNRECMLNEKVKRK